MKNESMALARQREIKRLEKRERERERERESERADTDSDIILFSIVVFARVWTIEKKRSSSPSNGLSSITAVLQIITVERKMTYSE